MRPLILVALLAAPAGAFPVTVTDDAGRAVRFESAPERVLSLAPSNTELMFAIGAGARLVGRTDACDHPPAAAEVASVGNLFPPDFERIVAAKPDLALMIDGNLEVRQKLVDRGVSVLVIQPRTVDAALEWLPRLGRVLGRGPEGEALAKTLKADLAEATANPPARRPRVFYEVWPEPLRTAGPRTFIADIIRRAGGEPVVKGEQDWPIYSTERLVADRPEVVITPHQKTLDAVKAGTRPGWGALPAVKAGRVHKLPDADVFVRAGPRVVEAVRWLAKTLRAK